jgi:hypothetical protein
MVKFSWALLSGAALIGPLSGNADDVLPRRFDFDRYTRMMDQSPFAIATAAVLPEQAPNFAKDLYIANAAHSPEGDVVTIMSSADQNFKKYLTTREPVDGYSIAQIEWSEDVGKTKVTISKDGQFATLTFNQSLLSKAASPGRQVADKMLPRTPLVPSPGANQVSRARARGVIERDPNAASAPQLERAPVPAEPVPPPNITLPKPLGGRQGLTEKQPSG